LDETQAQGYSVINIDWPVDASPNSLYEGFGARDYWSVDPQLGTAADWLAFVDDAHRRGLRVVADFNPSYFWTGAPAFKQALEDVAAYGIPRTSVFAGAQAMPADSPARWFRWNASCPQDSMVQPHDEHPTNGVTDGWVRVRSPAARGACYYSIWGKGQPCGDLASPEWRKELTSIIRHWIVDFKVDGFMLDAPTYYLAYDGPDQDDPISGRHDDVVVSRLREVIVEPAHALGAAVFGETYNLLRPPANKMLDGGRNTDMSAGAGGVPGFPGKLHAMVMSGDTSGLEHLLETTVDVLAGWSGGGAVRTEPDSRGNATIAGQKAAVTALLGTYYVVRMGAPNCTSPYPSFGPSPSGDEWPDGCFGKWAGATPAVAATLKAAHAHLRPGTARRVLNVSVLRGALRGAEKGEGRVGVTAPVYAALREAVGGGSDDGSDARAAVLVFNFSPFPVTVSIDVAGSGVAVPQESEDLIRGGAGPDIVAGGVCDRAGCGGWREMTSKRARQSGGRYDRSTHCVVFTVSIEWERWEARCTLSPQHIKAYSSRIRINWCI
jgi:hypothetical protein